MRPTDYKKEMCDKVDEYLATTVDEVTDKGVTVNLPSKEDFADYIGVCEKTIYNWEDDHPEFLQALGKIMRAQKKRLMNMGLAGQYNSTIAKLILSSNHGMREGKDVTSDGESIKGNQIVFAEFDEDDSAEG